MINENENKILQIGKTYKLVIFSCNQTLTYTGTIVSIDNNFVSFTDKYNFKFIYNLNSIISLAEVSIK